MDAKRDRILSKLGKILARAKSTNVHEASTARKMAEDLMSKHGITEADIAGHTESGYYELPMGAAGFNATWKFALVTAAARYNGCEAIALQSGRRRKVRIVGERADVDRAAEFFKQLLATLAGLERRAADQLDDLDPMDYDLTIRQCTDSFRRGAVACIIEKLVKSRPTRFGRRPKKQSSTSEQPFDPPSTVPIPPEAQPNRPSWWDPRTWFGKPVTETVFQPMALAKVEVDKEKEHAEKIKSKYDPKLKPLDLDDASSFSWYHLGYQLAEDNVVIAQDPVADEEPPSDEDKKGG